MKTIIIKSFRDCFTYYKAEKSKDYVIISIQDTPNGFGKTFEPTKNCIDVITLYFDDIISEESGYKLMTKEQAKKLALFIKKHKDIDTFIVHCKFGQSRSVAIGLAIKEYYGGKVITDNKQVPNEHVYKLLTEELNKTKRKWFKSF